MNSNAHGPFMSIPSIAISVHRLPICKNCGNSSAKSAMSTSVCFKARSFCAHLRIWKLFRGLSAAVSNHFKSQQLEHTRHRPDFLLHRSTEDWDISKCYNMFYADLFAFVRHQRHFWGPQALLHLVFSKRRFQISQYATTLTLSSACHAMLFPKNPPTGWENRQVRHSLCTKWAIVFFVASVVCSLPS